MSTETDKFSWRSIIEKGNSGADTLTAPFETESYPLNNWL